MPDIQTGTEPCPVCGHEKVEGRQWLHPAIAAALTTAIVYFLYQLSDMFSKVQSFEIYSTPPGIAELLKLLSTVIAIVAAGCGLNVKTLITSVTGAFGGAQGER